MSAKSEEVALWGRGDSNPHALRHMVLSHARLPIPALPRLQFSVYENLSQLGLEVKLRQDGSG
jgi:hypothetical protein